MRSQPAVEYADARRYIAILAAAVGYLATARRYWRDWKPGRYLFPLLVIYHVIRRWMLIQRR